MSSIQGINHSSVAAERILPKMNSGAGKAQSRPGAEIAPEPPGNTTSSARGIEDGSAPGVPRTHPPEAADNLLARVPAQQDRKLTTEANDEVDTPPEAPGQIAVVLLSMLDQTRSSSCPPATTHTLDVMA